MTPFDGTISSSYVTYAKDILQGCRDDYVLYRADQNEYHLFVGELELEDGHIISDDCQFIRLWQSSIPGNPAYIHYSSIAYSDFDLTLQDYLVYSNLGNYPRLVSGGDNYAFATLFLLCLVSITVLVLRIFDSLRRC